MRLAEVPMPRPVSISNIKLAPHQTRSKSGRSGRPSAQLFTALSSVSAATATILGVFPDENKSQ
eukprot:6212746-Pleurochrysis_carterae.AAC.3